MRTQGRYFETPNPKISVTMTGQDDPVRFARGSSTRECNGSDAGNTWLDGGQTRTRGSH